MYSNHPRNPVELSSRISVFRLNLGRFQSRIRTYTWQGFLRVFGDIFSNFFYWFTARKLIGKFRKIFIAAFRIGYLTVLVEFFLAQFVRFNTSILWVAHANFAFFLQIFEKIFYDVMKIFLANFCPEQFFDVVLQDPFGKFLIGLFEKCLVDFWLLLWTSSKYDSWIFTSFRITTFVVHNLRCFWWTFQV